MAKPLSWNYDPSTGEVRRENEVLGTFNPATGLFVYVTQDAKEKYKAKVPRILKDHGLAALTYSVVGSAEPPAEVGPEDAAEGDEIEEEKPLVPPIPPRPAAPEPTGPLGDKEPGYVRMLHDEFPDAFAVRYGVLSKTPSEDGRYPAERTTVLTFRA